MLGPIVALLLLTAPSAPAQQFCLFTSPCEGQSLSQQADQQQLRDRVERLERDAQRQRFEQTFNSPSTWTGGTGSRGSSLNNCFGAC